jgi:hypothetical protein
MESASSPVSSGPGMNPSVQQPDSPQKTEVSQSPPSRRSGTADPSLPVSPSGVSTPPVLEQSKDKTTPGGAKSKMKYILLGLVVLVLLAVGSLVGYYYLVIPFSTPEKVRLTNLTDRSVTVSWVTEEASPGVVIFNDSGSFKPSLLAGYGEMKAYDDRDVSEAELESVGSAATDQSGAILSGMNEVVVDDVGEYYVHHVTISGLDPETTYYFRIGNGVRFVEPSDEMETSFTLVSTDSFTTLPLLEDLQVPVPSYGAIKSAQGTVDDAIVYMEPLPGTGVLPLSSTVNDSGGWYIDLSSLRTPSGEVMPAEESDAYSEILYVEAGDMGVSDEIEITMDDDAPAQEIWVSKEESDETSSLLPKGLVAKAHAQGPGACTQADPCTVSPVDISKSLLGSELESLYPDADYATLEEALDDTVGREVWLKLLPIPDDMQDRVSRFIHSRAAHVLIVEQGQTSRPISNSVHLIGDVDAPSPYLKPAIALIYHCTDPVEGPTPPGPGATAEEMAEYLKAKARLGGCLGMSEYVKMGVSGTPILYFKNSANSSVEGVYFGQSMFQTPSTSPQQKAWYDDPDNMVAPIVVENSKVDIKDCDGDSRSNTDKTAKPMTSSWNDVEFNRVAYAIFDNSQGTVERTNISGFWAGGVLAKNGSDVTVKNSQMHTGGRWFGVAGVNSDVKMFNNAFYAINGQRFMGKPCGMPGAEPGNCGVQGLRNAYPDWIGPIPLWHYPVYGVWMQGGSLTMENNTLGEYQGPVVLSNVSSGTVKDNIFIVTYGSNLADGVTSTNSGGVSVSNNTKIQGYQGMLDNLRFEECMTGGGRISSLEGGSALPICYSIPKNGSEIVTNQTGAIYGQYASDWDEQELRYLETGCTLIPEYLSGYTCAESLSCSQTYGSCTKPGEEENPPNIGKPCHFEQNEDGQWHCISDDTPPSQDPAGSTEGGFGGSQGSEGAAVGRPNDIPVTPLPSASLPQVLAEGVRNLFAREVHAAQTYTVSDQYVISPDEDGVYDIEIPGEGVAEDVVMLEGEEYTFFKDDNGNGLWDEGEEQIVVEGITVELVVDEELTVETHEMDYGYNFVSLEALPSEVDSCKLIISLNDTGDSSVTKLARFESGRFEVTSFDPESQDPAVGDCFPVVPGRGYVVFSEGDDEFSYGGYRLAQPAPVAFDNPGWHLVGVNGNSRTYSASSLIDSINSEEALTVTNVTEWDKTTSRYSGIQKDEEDVYGFDFEIEPRTGYFVWVTEGSGTWTPE